ncbi:hypothetical protein [Microbacterium foliorum]|uniref:hypothetical protein n=1 Tax=Microbacterium foliorum TaxID=104336 RepID=UPI003735A738
MTYLTDRDLVLRFQEARPGRTLIAIEDVALPVTVLRVLVAAQEDKDLPLLEEFLLRGINAGLSSVEEVAALLGLAKTQLDSAMVNQLTVGNLGYHSATGKVGLTAQGKQTTLTLRAISPIDLELPASFDRTLWRVTEYRERDLITKSQARERAMHILPASRYEHVETSHLRLQDLEHLVQVEKRGHRHLQLLAILRASIVKHRYLPAKMLLFADDSQSVPEVAWVVDGEESPIHARVFEKLATDRLSRLKVLHNEVPTQGEVEAIVGAPSSSKYEQLEPTDQQALVRASLTGTDRRVSILTGRISAAVVDQAAVALLEANLRRGARITIAYYDVDGISSDEDAVHRLEQLQNRHSGFRFVKLERTSPHVLVADQRTLHTRMELLSFKSHPSATYHASHGRMYDNAEHANEAHEHVSLAAKSSS